MFILQDCVAWRGEEFMPMGEQNIYGGEEGSQRFNVAHVRWDSSSSLRFHQ